MNRKSILLLVLLIVSPILIYFLWPSDESRIKNLFREGARAVEEKKIDDVMARVSFNYSDEYGLTYLYVKELMQKVFQQMNGIKIDYEITKIDIKDIAAVVEVDIRGIATRGQDTGYFLGDAAKPAHLKFHLEKVRGKWMVDKTEGLPFQL